jgi:hypothetical protein
MIDLYSFPSLFFAFVLTIIHITKGRLVVAFVRAASSFLGVCLRQLLELGIFRLPQLLVSLQQVLFNGGRDREERVVAPNRSAKGWVVGEADGWWLERMGHRLVEMDREY